MNPQQELTGKWNALVTAVEQKYGALSGTELARVRGDMNKLAELVQQKSGQNREQVEAFFDECCAPDGAPDGAVEQTFADRRASAQPGPLGAAGEALAAQTRAGYDRSRRSIAEHPLESVAIAVGLGLAVGLLIGLSLATAPQSPPAARWRHGWRV